MTTPTIPTPEEYALEIADILRRKEVKKERNGSLVGIVVSDKNAKTISIKVDREKYFPKYDAILRRTKKFMAHDEYEICGMGDLVRIVPCRPMSRKKRHKVLDIIRKGDRLDFVLTPEEKRRDQNKYYPPTETLEPPQIAPSPSQ